MSALPPIDRRNWADRFVDRLPQPFRWLWSGWKAFGHALGLVMSRIILTVLWIVGFGPYGIVLRVASLLRPRPPRLPSTWIDVPEEKPDSYRRQY